MFPPSSADAEAPTCPQSQCFPLRQHIEVGNVGKEVVKQKLVLTAHIQPQVVSVGGTIAYRPTHPDYRVRVVALRAMYMHFSQGSTRKLVYLLLEKECDLYNSNNLYIYFLIRKATYIYTGA